MPDMFDLNRPASEARIVVAMSGGVDSSVTAALAAQTGAEVIGVTLQLYDYCEAARRPGACCAGQDIYDAKMVADRLGIAHYVLDYESRFRTGVIDRFVDESAHGRTPVPCSLWQPGREVHRPHRLRPRARRRLPRHRPLCAPVVDDGRRRAAQGRRSAPRPELFPLRHDRRQLDFLRFPLGDLPKTSASDRRELGLEVAAKPDSQDICFVPDGDYAGWSSAAAETEAPGDIVDLGGHVLGQHRGVVHFTVGQRRGIEIGGQREPLYVVRIEPEPRRLVVGPRRALAVEAMRVSRWNWIGEDQRDVSVKVRSLAPAVPARDRWRVDPLRAAPNMESPGAGGGGL
jgi:tRNA-specific 2-thiouridylase